MVLVLTVETDEDGTEDRAEDDKVGDENRDNREDAARLVDGSDVAEERLPVPAAGVPAAAAVAVAGVAARGLAEAGVVRRL